MNKYHITLVKDLKIGDWIKYKETHLHINEVHKNCVKASKKAFDYLNRLSISTSTHLYDDLQNRVLKIGELTNE